MNKDISNDNMQEETCVAHRRVYHGVISSGYEFPITKEMLALCKHSCKADSIFCVSHQMDLCPSGLSAARKVGTDEFLLLS